jgi:cold shock protein
VYVLYTSRSPIPAGVRLLSVMAGAHRSKTRPRSTTVDRHNRRGEEESMTQGTVRWFNRIKGIGFLNVDGGEPDVFVHFSAIETDNARSLDENRRVEFDIIKGERTRQAARVRYI